MKGWTTKTQNAKWGSILAPSRKMLKTAEKLKLDKNEVKSKVQGVFLKGPPIGPHPLFPEPVKH